MVENAENTIVNGHMTEVVALSERCLSKDYSSIYY